MAKLESICTMNMGQSPDSASYNRDGEGLPFFQGNADFGEISPKVRVWCSAPQKIAHDGDILISVRAPIGALNIADATCCIGRGLAALTINESVCEKKYLWYAIATKVDELNAKGTGSTFKAITKSILAELEIPLPPITQQQKIAVTLDKITGLISLRKQQLSMLDELVKTRFIEMFGDENNSKQWENVTIGDVADVRVGVVIKPAQYYTDDEKGTKAFRSLNVGEMKIRDYDWVYFSDLGNDMNSRSILKENDILVVRSGAPGTCCVVTREFEGSNAIDVIIVRPNRKRVNPYYLAAYTNFSHGKKQISEGTGGAAQQHFNIGKYKAIKLMLPPINVQNEFSDFISHIDNTKTEVQKSYEKLETLKKALMQHYFD